MKDINANRLKKLKDYLYDEILENYGWLPPEDDYTDSNKIEYYKENFIKQFKYNFMENINECIAELNERQNIIEKVKLL
jgi:hypothetical protein